MKGEEEKKGKIPVGWTKLILFSCSSNFRNTVFGKKSLDHKLELQEYLNSEEFSNTECELFFAIRSNSVRGLKANTPSVFKNNLSCSLKYNLSESIDDQQLTN